MDLMDQSEWFVDSMLEDEPFENADESAYPEILDNVIGDVNMPWIYYKMIILYS